MRLQLHSTERPELAGSIDLLEEPGVVACDVGKHRSTPAGDEVSRGHRVAVRPARVRPEPKRPRPPVGGELPRLGDARPELAGTRIDRDERLVDRAPEPDVVLVGHPLRVERERVARLDEGEVRARRAPAEQRRRGEDRREQEGRDEELHGNGIDRRRAAGACNP
jgi:hypothetical protein